MNLFESVAELCKTSPLPHFAVFDFDGSIIHHDSAEATLAYMARHRISNARVDFASYYSLLDSGDVRAAYRFGAATLQGLSTEEVDTIVQKTMAEEGTEITKTEFLGRTIARGIALRENVVGILRWLQSGGVEVWVVSASPELVVRSAMKYFNLDAKVIGVRNIVEDGVLTAKLREPLSIFEGKVDCIKESIHPSVKPLLGVGDSMNDYPMLDYSRLRAVINRGDALAAKAKANDWFIL